MKTSWREVLRDCVALAKPYGTERVVRRSAQGRVLAEEVVADRDYPAADLSMMDGYAVGAEQRESYDVAGENTPGTGAGAPLASGTARRIFTGAELPAGATRIVPQENIRREGDTIAINQWPDTPFVRPRGREAKQGDVILTKGALIGPIELAALATVGCREPLVIKTPRLSHLVTGDEIADADDPFVVGRIRDSNSSLVAGLLAEVGLFVGHHTRISDSCDHVLDAVEAFGNVSDVLLISGGASVGDHDYTRPALEAAGFTFLAHGLHVRPGRPIGIARRAEQWAFALPGNPLSHLIVLRLLVIPVLRACCGETEVEPQFLRGVLDSDIDREIPRRDTFWPAHLSIRDGQLHARPGRFLSSGDLIGATGINGFVHLPAGEPVPAPGQAVDILPLTPTFP
jgi:molybdopterin molybdotransferase